jgi:predicted TIM-barrel fold metal-dependent hydrolase
MKSAGRAFALGCSLAACALAGTTAAGEPSSPLFNDSHFHLTNYIQRGPSIGSFLSLMGDRVGRVAIFGIPLQQTWSYENSGDFAPSYYLQTDAPLYYYSFTDAYIAKEYESLSRKDRARFDPMITGFNPADMYAADHIRRVLQTFPGVFSGIGEFTIHKEFVSSKVAGDTASLTDPALDRIFDLAGEVGLLVLIHNDIDMPFAKAGSEPVYLTQMKDLLRRHPGAKTIWAHLGLGRVIRPVQSQAASGPAERSPSHGEIVEAILDDPALSHVYFDISWSEVAKYLTSTPEALQNSARIINRHPDRFLFGTDEVAPTEVEAYLSVYGQYEPLWKLLTPEAREAVQKGNYEWLFDAARLKVRAWESAHPR